MMTNLQFNTHNFLFKDIICLDKNSKMRICFNTFCNLIKMNMYINSDSKIYSNIILKEFDEKVFIFKNNPKYLNNAFITSFITYF